MKSIVAAAVAAAILIITFSFVEYEEEKVFIVEALIPPPPLLEQHRHQFKQQHKQRHCLEHCPKHVQLIKTNNINNAYSDEVPKLWLHRQNRRQGGCNENSILHVQEEEVDSDEDLSTTTTTTTTTKQHQRQQRRQKVIDYKYFCKLAIAASNSNRPLLLRGRSANLGINDLKLNNNDCENVHIVGPGCISGEGHSLFTTGGRRQKLIINNVSLIHLNSTYRKEKREQGAAIWARGKSCITLSNCTVTTQGGYSIWLVQNAVANLTSCIIGPCGRSGVVLFGKSKLVFENGTINDALTHGICARGDTSIKTRHSNIVGCGQRGIYAYHNATLEMVNTNITGTLARDCSAVQVESLRPGDKAKLKIRTCVVDEANHGFGLSVAGNVHCEIDKSVQIESSLSAIEQLQQPRQQ